MRLRLHKFARISTVCARQMPQLVFSFCFSVIFITTARGCFVPFVWRFVCETILKTIMLIMRMHEHAFGDFFLFNSFFFVLLLPPSPFGLALGQTSSFECNIFIVSVVGCETNELKWNGIYGGRLNYANDCRFRMRRPQEWFDGSFVAELPGWE